MFNKLLKNVRGWGANCTFPFARRLLFLLLCFGASASFGAYQYIISGSPAANPSETAYSAAVSVNAQSAGNLTLNTALETRYHTFESAVNDFVLCRMKPGMLIIVR